MSNDIFKIKRNDTSPSFLLELDLPSGTDLTGATVRFHMAQADGTVIVDAAGSVESVSDQTIRYDWIAADTATSGMYNAEFEVTFSGGAVETFPNEGYYRVKVGADIT
jgi:hypothetical protein